MGEFIQVLCDRHVQRPDQVWELCVFEELTGWATTAPYRRRAQMFQQCLRNYLFGSGTPESPPGLHVEEELADHMISATVLRGSILLAAVTECEDLPTDPDYRIQVRQSICTHYFSLRAPVQLAFHCRDLNTNLSDPYVQRSN